MKELIHNFLTETYYMDLSTWSSYNLKKHSNSESIYHKSLFICLSKVFGYTEDSKELTDIVDEWTRQEIGKLTRKINHIKYRLYSTTGSDVIALKDMQKLIRDFEE